MKLFALLFFAATLMVGAAQATQKEAKKVPYPQAEAWITGEQEFKVKGGDTVTFAVRAQGHQNLRVVGPAGSEITSVFAGNQFYGADRDTLAEVWDISFSRAYADKVAWLNHPAGFLAQTYELKVTVPITEKSKKILITIDAYGGTNKVHTEAKIHVVGKPFLGLLQLPEKIKFGERLLLSCAEEQNLSKIFVNGMSFSSCDGGFPFTPQQIGPFTVEIYAENELGEKTTPTAQTVTVLPPKSEF